MKIVWGDGGSVDRGVEGGRVREFNEEGGRERVVGAERDPVRIAEALAGGESVLVAGSLGSGKSHLLRAVASALREAGIEPLVIRPGRQTRRIPFGAIDDAQDPRGELLRSGAPLDPPLAVVVDDAQELDTDSTDLLVRAIHARRAVAVLGISTPRARSTGPVPDAADATAFVDLWLHGFAQRMDLHELTPAEAEDLLAEFPGAAGFDAVTRAMVIGLCDGSRILLRELAEQAAAAIAAGRDPLDSIREIHRHSRLDDALSAHLAEHGEEERSALALLGRLRGIDHADATRLIAASTVDGLIANGLVHDDETVRRRLYANAALAAEAAHHLPPGALDAAIERAATRMLDAAGVWWSAPVAALVAERWHGAPDALPSWSATPPALRRRVALDAARRANDGGRPALAIAYATLAEDDDAPALALEHDRAVALVSRDGGGLATIDPATLDAPLLRRYLRLGIHLLAPLGPDRAEELVHAADRGDERTRAEVELALAETAACRMEWAVADDAARRAADLTGADAITRARALRTSAVARINDGDGEEAAVLLDRANRLLRTPGAAPSRCTSERLLAVCVELMAAEVARVEPVAAQDRLRGETILAAREGYGPGIVMASLGAALVHARAGRADRAIAELDVSAQRAVHLPLGPALPLIHLAVARSVALLGRPDDARAVLHRALETAGAAVPAVRHARRLTESCVLAAEGRTDEARACAEEARALSDGSGARLLHFRDLYQVAALGGADEVLLQRMRRIADATDVRAARILVDHVADLVRGRKSMTRRTPVDLLRLATSWSAAEPLGVEPAGAWTSPAPSLRRRIPGPTAPLTALRPFGLTRREREIGELVADGLSNREIAGRLYLSVRTVESHVYQARAKVGARSRSDLGRLLGPREATRNGTDGAR